MSKDSIIIIGNGFDVSHGVPSRYSDFKTWLKNNNEPLYRTLNRYIDISGDWWNEFEDSLAAFHVPRLIQDAPKDYPLQDPRFPPSPYYPANKFFRDIRKQVSNSFIAWVKTLSSFSPKPKMALPSARLYISFNYTNTLEKVYGVPEAKILYIHGKAERGDELIFGHGKSYQEIENDTMARYNLYRSGSLFIADTYGDAEYQLTTEISFLDKFPYAQIVKYESVLIPAVVSAKTIWVYGLAFSKGDYQYIEWIAMKNPSLFWRVSWHTEKDRLQITEALRDLDVTNFVLYQT